MHIHYASQLCKETETENRSEKVYSCPLRTVRHFCDIYQLYLSVMLFITPGKVL